MTHTLQRERLVAGGLYVVLLAGLAALFGTYWDNAWHTDVGRDDFFSPPHLLLYAGVAVMGGVAVLWALASWRETRSLRAVFARPVLRLAIVGVVATFLAAPIDEFWHHAFGRDAVIWSPPHMVGFAALFALATGFMLEAGRLPGRPGVVLSVAMAALLLGAAHVPVMEYESDVPQFALLWYLPVLTVGTLLAFALIELRQRVVWLVTAAAVTYTVIRAGIVVGLAALDHSLIFVPPIVASALVFELTGRRGWSPAARATAYAAASAVVYAPFLRLAQGGIQLGAGDVVVGAAIAAVAGWAVLAVMRGPVPRPAPRHAMALLAALLLAPAAAFAHDPGQGARVGEARFRAVPDAGTLALGVQVVLEDARPCADLGAGRVVARRAGSVREAALVPVAPCEFGGELELPGRGRWFVYAEFTLDDVVVEAWLPVIMAAAGPTLRTADIYAPPARGDGFSPLQIASGVLLYGVCIWFIALAVGAARRERAPAARMHERSGVRPAAVALRHGGAVLVVACAGLALFAGPAAARQSTEGEPHVGGRHLVLPFPVFYRTDETGLAGGVDVMHSYRRDVHTHPAMSHLSVVYTEKGQVMSHVGTDVYTAANRYRLSAHATYMHFPATFHGIGRDLSHDAGEPYTPRSLAVAVSARRRAGSGYFVGGGWNAARHEVLQRAPDGMLAGGGITGSDGGTVTGLSLSGGRDTRDGLHSPRRGAHVVIGISGYHALFGSDFRFAQVNGEYRHYVALPAGQTLAAQALVSTTLGDAPFQALPRLGGSGLMRGHSPALNRDRNVVGAQLEQRLPLLWRFGAVGFAGAGAVTSRLRSLDSDAVRYSYGGGLRFAFDRQDRFNLRADVGVGRNGAVLYLGAGEAF